MQKNKFGNIRLAIAAYSLREWETAREYFQKLIETFPSTQTDASEQLARTRKRLIERNEGVYDIERLYEEAYIEKKRRLDVADYRGPIEVEKIPNKGKGFVASKDIAKGTLLLAEKAYSCAYNEESDESFLNGMPSFFLTILGAIHNLQSNSSKTRELYSLYAGPNFSHCNEQQISEGSILHYLDIWIHENRFSCLLGPGRPDLPSLREKSRSTFSSHIFLTFVIIPHFTLISKN